MKDMSKRFYNCHAHCFTYDHVPEYFLTNAIAISWLLKRKWLRHLIHQTPITGSFGFLGDLIVALLALVLGFNKTKAIRLFNFIKYGDRKTQEDVIKSMQAYYPKSTGFVLLTMDLEYMGAGIPRTRFEKQLSQLEGLQRNPEWKHKLYPFIFCDPRRIQPLKPEEVGVESGFVGHVFLEKLKTYIEEKTYQGIKLYPALGYFPFDQRLKPVYDFGLQHCVPFMTHCTVGAVHFKYKLGVNDRYHPFKKETLPGLKPGAFQTYYTHPLNYECLMNRDLLKQFWGDESPDYSGLKICIGHWGTGEDWHNYLNNPWLETSFRNMSADFPSLELANWHIANGKETYNFSWFTIICDLMRKYPNVYADISYTLNDEKLLPLLKMLLETDEIIRKKVLFGTDFYMVSKSICERQYAINVRAALGNELFEQIAITNAERYLNNSFQSVRSQFIGKRSRLLVESGICNSIAIIEDTSDIKEM
jgi:hypothetical protein